MAIKDLQRFIQNSGNQQTGGSDISMEEFARRNRESAEAAIDEYEKWKQDKLTGSDNAQQNLRDRYYDASGMDYFRRDFNDYVSAGAGMSDSDKIWEQNIKNQRDYFSRYAKYFSDDELRQFNGELDYYESIVKQRMENGGANENQEYPEYITIAGYQSKLPSVLVSGNRGEAFDISQYSEDVIAEHSGTILEKQNQLADSAKTRMDAAEKNVNDVDQVINAFLKSSDISFDEKGNIVFKNSNDRAQYNRLLSQRESYVNEYYQAQADYNYSAEVFNATREIYMRKYDAARSAEEIDAEIDAAERGEIELTPTEKQALMVEKRFAEDKNARRIAENALEYVDGNGLADVPKIESVMTSTQTRIEEIDQRIEEIDLDIKNQDFLIDYTLKADVLTDADKLYIEEQNQIKENLQKEKDALLKERETVEEKNKKATEVYSYIWGSTFMQMQKDENFADKVAKGKERYDAEYQAFQDEVTNDRAFKTTVALTPEENLYYELAPYYSAGRRKHPIAVDITMLSQEEQDNFYYLCAIGQDQLAVEYVQQIAMNDRRETLNEIADWAGTNTGTRLLASIGSVLLLPVSGSDMQLYGANMAWSGASGGIGIGATGDALRGGAAQGLTEKGLFNTGFLAGTFDEDLPVIGGKGIGDVYQLGMSSVDSLVFGSLLGKHATTFILGNKAASSSFNDAINKGATYEQAVLQGVTHGIAEALYEYISLDMLLSGGITKNIILQALIQGGVEASEEIMTSITNEITDRAIMKDLSEFETTKREYMEQGYSESEAEDMATRKMWEGIAFDGIGGLLSGGGMSLMYSGTIGKQEEFQDYMGKWAEAALQFDPSSDIYQEGFKMQALLKSGEEISEEYMQGVYERIGKDGFAQVSERVNMAEAVEQAEGRIGDIDQTFFNPETAVTDVYDTIDAYKEVANTAMQEKNASKLLVTTANAVKMLDAAQTNLESALEQGLIDQNEYSDMRQIVEDARSRAQEILDLYMNQSRSAGTAGLSTEMQPVQEQQEADSVGMQAYLDAGASEAEAISAGEILDGILRGEITSNNITNQQIMELMAETGFGREAIAQTLGVEVTEEKTTSAMRRAVKRAIAQYENNTAQQDAAVEKQEATAQPGTTEGGNENAAEGTQSVRRDRGRNDGVDPGEQAGSVGESGSQRTAQRRAEGNGQQNNEKALRRKRQKERIKRYESLTDTTDAQKIFNSTKYEGDIAVVPEELYTKKMKDAAREVEEELGVKVIYFKGTLIREDASRRMRRTAGFFDRARNEIWATVGSELFEPEQLVYHEKYHAFVAGKRADVMQTVDKIMEQFDVDELKALVQRYVRAYAGVYDNESVKDIYEELLADAYAGMNRFGDTQNATQYQQAVKENLRSETRENERAMRDTRGAPESKFSINETDDGRAVAVVDSDILSHIDTTVWDKIKKAQAKKAAKTALLAFKDGVQVNGITYKVNKVSRDEFTRSNDTERLYRKEKEIFADKLRASANADDVITATTSWAKDGMLTHPRTDNFVDFVHGEVLIQAGTNQYEAETVVGITDAGEYVFYDVVDMEPTSFKVKEEPSTAATGIDAESAIQESSSIESITEKGLPVKQKLSFDDEDYLLAVEAGDMDAAQEMVDEAAKAAVNQNNVNSYLLNEDGTPMKVYRGRNGDYTVFDKRMIRKRNDGIEGFFFSPPARRESVAAYYGDGKTDAFYLLLKNPVVVTTDERIDASRAREYDGIIRLADREFSGQYYNYSSDTVETERLKKGDIVEIVAFYPEQIKSADPVTYDDNGNVIPLSERFNSENADIRYSLEDDVAETDGEYREKMDSEQKPHRTAEDLKREIKETLLRGQETKQTPTATVTLKMPESDVYKTETTVTHEYGIGKPFYSRNTTLTPKEAIGYLEAATGMKWQAVPMKKGLWKAEMTTEELDTVFAPRGYSKYVVEMKERGEKPLSQKEYAQEMLAKAWRDPNEPSAATVHPEGVRKADFSASPALEKIGVKIDGSVVDYETTQQIRQAEDARFNIQKTIKSTIRRYGATNKEVAHAKSIAEGIDSYFDVPESCRFHVVSELAGLYMDERMAGNNLVSQRKIAIKTALLDKAIEMFPKDKQIQENPDLFHPTKLLTMNYRTPERNMYKIFGDELGGQIYDYYFAPVQANEAERTRWMQKQFDEVRKFRGEDGKLKKLNKAESAYTHELLDLQSYAEKVEASEKKDDILKAAEKLRRLQGEGKVDKNTRWNLAVEFDLDRAQSEWMMKYAQWLTMKEGKPESVDETRCMEAAKKYRELFDDYFDAINDFLVSHGGNPIGKIEGYAPHISLNEKVNLLNQTLEKLGFNDNATKLPAEIAGLTEEFRPDKRWTPFFQKRNGSKTDYDIVEGFERYVTYISDVLYHMDDIQKLRAAESYLRMGISGSFDTSIEEAIEESRMPDINDRIDYLIDMGRIEVKERGDYTEKEVTEAFSEFIDSLIKEQKTNTRYSDLADWMMNYTNVLAGKQFGGDRGIEHMGGRGLLTLGNRINAVFARANVAGNLSSALNQRAQLSAILSKRRVSSVARAIGELTTGRLREFAMESDYITAKKGVKYVARSVGDMFIEGVFKPVEFVDSMMSTLAVRSAYLDGIKNGMTETEAMRFADNFGRKIMADRSKGSKPNAFHSKGFVRQMLHAFQLESLNSWENISQDLPRDFRQIARDGGKAKAARALALTLLKYLIAAFVLNRWSEEVYGGTPAPFDLFGMTANFIASGNGLTTNEWIKRTINKVTGVDIFEESSYEAFDEFDWGAAAEDTVYNLTNEIPFVSNISGMLGLGDRTLPTALPGIVDAVTGIYDAASENGVFSDDTALALVELLKSTIPGGRQIGKTIGGIRAAIEGGKMNGTGENERLQYVTDDSVLGIIQQVLFGVNATEEAKAHYASGENGLTARQTQMWKEITEQGGDGTELFELIQGHRRIGNDDTLTSAERSELQRDAIAGSSFTDEQKAYIYSVLFGDKDGTSQDEPFEELMDAGMSWDAITEMFNEYKRIYNDDSIGASEQTTEFQYWIDKQNYTKKQREIINDSFRYGRYSSVDPNESNYSKLVAQGVSPEDAKRIVENTTASDGEGVKQQDKVDAILKQNMSDDKTYAALGAVLNENAYDALTEARAAGISCRVFMEFRSKAGNMKADKDPNDPEKTIAGSKKEKVVELIDSLQLTTEQKDVLYLMYYAESGLYDTPWH